MENSNMHTPFCFENVDVEDVVISIKKNDNSAYTATLETSVDNVNWTPWGSTSETPLTYTIGVGERLYIRNTADVGYINNTYWCCNYFRSTGAVRVSGNLMSLGYKDFENYNTIDMDAAYIGLFFNMDKLVDTSRLLLPATTLTICCYSCMFWNCTALTTTPELPATKLADCCYSSMFDNCTSLITAPELPATELASGCYVSMFRYCTSLVTPPTLPATTLAEYCYNYMFSGCTSLTTTPTLPATTLANGCYQHMFQGCTSLTTTPELPTTKLAFYCYDGMFEGCTSLET